MIARPIYNADSPLDHTMSDEVRALRLQVKAIAGRLPQRPVDSRGVETLLRFGDLRAESHRVDEQLARDAGCRLRIGLSSNSACLATVIPQLPDGRIGLIVRYRFAPAKWSLEFPRAHSDLGDETWRNTCDRVLALATPWTGSEMTLLGGLQVEPECMSVRSIVALARVQATARTIDWDEQQMIAGAVCVSPGALDALIMQGDIDCGVTLAALMLARIHSGSASRHDALAAEVNGAVTKPNKS